MIGWLALVGAVVFNAVAQVVLKQGADRLKLVHGDGLFEKGLSFVTDAPQVIVGIVLYGMSFVLYTYTLSRHELSWAYPMVAVGYALVLFLSWRILNEEISALRVAGTLVICAGVALVARS